MIINYFTDNDLYKFSVMHAIQKKYPWAYVKYEFISRDKTKFSREFVALLRNEINSMSQLSLTKEEKRFIQKRCYFFDPVFIDFLEGYRYNPEEVTIDLSEDGELKLSVEGYWYRTVLWEVPLMALISELYFRLNNDSPIEVETRAKKKAEALNAISADFSEFGTRRRFSFDVQDTVVKTLKEYGANSFKGTSNIYLAMKHDCTPIGTMPHEWFMYHGAIYGYRSANMKALEAWVDVFQGSLGITLTDTYTTDIFIDSFSLKQAILFDGVRWDSGDPLAFIDKIISFYKKNRIDPSSKTLVFSDSLDLDKVKEIKEYVGGRIHDTYGIGTYFSNDVGAIPLNMVIKLTDVKTDPHAKYHKAVKLSDTSGKNTGNAKEIELCKLTLSLK